MEKDSPTSFPAYREFNLWRNAFAFSIILFCLLSAYSYFADGVFNIRTANKMAADTAYILIGLSFAFSGLSYFFRLSPNIFNYRKYLGILGAFYAFAHSAYSGVMYVFNPVIPTFYFFQTWNFFGREVSNLVAFSAGAISLIILLGMTIISNKRAIQWLGKKWRPLLRVGYVSVFLVIFHFSIKKSLSWASYFSYPDGLPPLTIFMALFGIFVIGLRAALFIALKVKSPERKP